jgi:hypothetical protein
MVGRELTTQHMLRFGRAGVLTSRYVDSRRHVAIHVKMGVQPPRGSRVAVLRRQVSGLRDRGQRFDHAPIDGRNELTNVPAADATGRLHLVRQSTRTSGRSMPWNSLAEICAIGTKDKLTFSQTSPAARLHKVGVPCVSRQTWLNCQLRGLRGRAPLPQWSAAIVGGQSVQPSNPEPQVSPPLSVARGRKISQVAHKSPLDL